MYQVYILKGAAGRSYIGVSGDWTVCQIVALQG